MENETQAEFDTDSVETMSPEDEADRERAFAELAAGEALALREAMKEW